MDKNNKDKSKIDDDFKTPLIQQEQPNYSKDKKIGNKPQEMKQMSGIYQESNDAPDISATIDNLKKQADKEKKKSISSYGVAEAKSFGVKGFFAFMFPRLWKQGSWSKFIIIFNLVTTVVLKLITVASPILFKEVVDSIVCDKDSTALKTWLFKKSTTTCPEDYEINVLIALYVLSHFLIETIKTLREIPYSNMAALAEISITHDVYNHVQRQSLGYHLNRSTGKIVRQVSKGASSFANVTRVLFFQFISILTQIILTLITFGLLFHWSFVVVELGCIVLYIIATFILTEMRKKTFVELNKADNNYNVKATDSLLNFETVKYFNAEKHEEDRFGKALDIYMLKHVAVAMGLCWLNIGQGVMTMVGMAAMLSLAFHYNLTGLITVGSFIMFSQFNIQIFTAMTNLGMFWKTLRQGMIDVEQILNLLHVNDQIQEVERPVIDRTKGGAIEFRNVSFTYDIKLKEHEQRTIIDNVSFTIPAGKSVGIVGQTGSGKSTLMRLLYRFYDVTAGTIFIDGQDISKLKITDLRRNIAIVPQDCVLFNDSIMYNIAYGGIDGKTNIQKIIDDPKKSDELIRKIIPSAKRAQIHNFVMGLTKGYYEAVGERGLKLSGGEKQRVAIARALLKRTPIMCFDEATSALDTQTERDIQQSINEVSKDATTLIIAHRLSTVRDCDRIIVLKFGAIVEQGSHDELIQIKNGYYKRLWEKQSEQQAAMQKDLEEKTKLSKEKEQAFEERKK